MELELCKETYSCYEALPPLVETREQSTETIVPDYCPDIARIVEGSGCPFGRGRRAVGALASVSGSLRMTLLYIADGSGGLKSFSYTLPVEETLDGRLREGCTEASVSGCVSALEVRALNPRKIMTRAAVELTVTPYCAAQLTACGDVTQRAENGIETLCETQEVSIIKALRSKDFVFSDDLVLSSSKEPAAELLRESASVRTTECRLIGGKIILKGVVCVEVLYLSESGTICSAAAELPFSQIVEGVEDADENTSAEAMLCLTGAELRIGGEGGELEFCHTPFSMPAGGLDVLLKAERGEIDPLTITADQYDLVCNGVELSSGAVRNHDPEIMIKAFELVRLGEEDVKAKFPAMYNAFCYGAPPHAGIAPGVDRMVMLLAGEDSIREIIPFPMNKNAQDIMMGAPSEVTQKQLDELHIAVTAHEEE